MGVPEEGRRRVAIERVSPELDGGRVPIKRVVEDNLEVEADIFADGHDVISCLLLHRVERDADWTRAPMDPLGNDRWHGELTVHEVGRHYYTLLAWPDRFRTWRRDLRKKAEAGQDVSVDLLTGAHMAEEAAARAGDADAAGLRRWAEALRQGSNPDRLPLALDEVAAQLMAKHPDTRFATRYKELPLVVDARLARFSAWYEMFPRSASPDPARAGTLKDVEARLPYVASMGFDVLYLPPLHPIGRSHRKGRNNAPLAAQGDAGSPWAIGSEEGGHKAIDPALGTLEDFRRLVARGRERGMETAIDLAFQCSPDHPWVKEHPSWFRRRPDGAVQYAENPPKKYEDIYPLNFETDDRQALWEELKSVVFFWAEQGVRVFRVDNPHTKPFPFWEWLIREVKKAYPEAIFLAEAFTRPKVMRRLAKLGFSQSYTYFAWRNTKEELTEYLTELTQSEAREYLRPNFWPNTPDILTEYLQHGGRAAFLARLVLAATLSPSYGIYGPPFELMERVPREPGSEEYLDSEKYQARHWDIEQGNSLRHFIARINLARRRNPALQNNCDLTFHSIDNNELICYSKSVGDLAPNVILVVVNLDPHHRHGGWLELPLEELGISSRRPYQVHDLLSDVRYHWQGSRNYVEIDPQIAPAHVFRIRRQVRSEQDFEYYM